MAGSLRPAITCWRTCRIRSTGSDSPTGAAIVTPANRLPEAGSSAPRRLTGRASGSASTGTPSTSWYRPSPPHSAARYASLHRRRPTALAAARKSARGSSSTTVRLTRLRRRSSGDGSAARRAEHAAGRIANPTASVTVAPGCVISRAAVPAARPSSLRPANVVSGSCLMLSRSRSCRSRRGGPAPAASAAAPGPVRCRRPARTGRCRQPVGDRVAELGQQRGPAALQALDVHRLPQRARGVERRLQRHFGQVERAGAACPGRAARPGAGGSPGRSRDRPPSAAEWRAAAGSPPSAAS